MMRLDEAVLQRYRPYGTQERISIVHFIDTSKGAFTQEPIVCCEKHIHFSKIDTYGAVS